MTKIIILLAVSLLLFTHIGADSSHLVIYTVIISLFHIPYSFYDRCYLRKKITTGNQADISKREKKYTE